MEQEQYLQITRPANQCSLCGQPLGGDQSRHPSILAETEGKMERRDICPTCWERVGDLSYFSFWLAKRVRSLPNRKLAKAERNEILWRLFSALTVRTDLEHEPHLFLLAHLLMKYGLLKFRGNERDGEGAWILFEHPNSGERFRVRDRDLNDEALIRTLQEIESLVTREVNPDLSDAVSL